MIAVNLYATRSKRHSLATFSDSLTPKALNPRIGASAHRRIKLRYSTTPNHHDVAPPFPCMCIFIGFKLIDSLIMTA
jgi:hypothetical protein